MPSGQRCQKWGTRDQRDQDQDHEAKRGCVVHKVRKYEWTKWQPYRYHCVRHPTYPFFKDNKSSAKYPKISFWRQMKILVPRCQESLQGTLWSANSLTRLVRSYQGGFRALRASTDSRYPTTVVSTLLHVQTRVWKQQRSSRPLGILGCHPPRRQKLTTRLRL